MISLVSAMGAETTNLHYANDSIWDENNDGIETSKGVIDYSIVGTFDKLKKGEKACTLWSTTSQETEETVDRCYGDTKCCTIHQLLPSNKEWDAPYHLYMGRDGATLNNTVSAQVLVTKDKDKTLLGKTSSRGRSTSITEERSSKSTVYSKESLHGIFTTEKSSFGTLSNSTPEINQEVILHIKDPKSIELIRLYYPTGESYGFLEIDNNMSFFPQSAGTYEYVLQSPSGNQSLTFTVAEIIKPNIYLRKEPAMIQNDVWIDTLVGVDIIDATLTTPSSNSYEFLDEVYFIPKEMGRHTIQLTISKDNTTQKENISFIVENNMAILNINTLGKNTIQHRLSDAPYEYEVDQPFYVLERFKNYTITIQEQSADDTLEITVPFEYDTSIDITKSTLTKSPWAEIIHYQITGIQNPISTLSFNPLTTATFFCNNYSISSENCKDRWKALNISTNNSNRIITSTNKFAIGSY